MDGFLVGTSESLVLIGWDGMGNGMMEIGMDGFQP